MGEGSYGGVIPRDFWMWTHVDGVKVHVGVCGTGVWALKLKNLILITARFLGISARYEHDTL